jgi:hypothetical protein
MSGRITVAPCGHTGETIIGTYVKCLMGCEGAAVISKRAEPGHVLNCKCKPCQIRQRAVAIVLRTRDGKDFIRIDWDGTTDEIVFDATKSGDIKNYVFLDADGKPVAKGSTSAYLMPGQARIKARFMLNDADSTKMCVGAVEMVHEETLEEMVAQVQKIILTNMMAPPVGFFIP